MPLDINTIRAYKGGDPEKVRESQRRRFADVALVDKVIAEDEEWRRPELAADDKRGENNAKARRTRRPLSRRRRATASIATCHAIDAK